MEACIGSPDARSRAPGLRPEESTLLPARDDDDTQPLMLSGRMSPYSWGIDGGPRGLNEPIEMTEGHRVKFAMMNHTCMAHPMHVHGHTFALEGGLRKDTCWCRR